jgi:hypothetical protein
LESCSAPPLRSSAALNSPMSSSLQYLLPALYPCPVVPPECRGVCQDEAGANRGARLCLTEGQELEFIFRMGYSWHPLTAVELRITPGPEMVHGAEGGAQKIMGRFLN